MRTVSYRHKATAFLAACCASMALLLGGASAASAAPVWKIDSLSNTTAPAGGELRYLLQISNVGDVDTTGPYAVKATLPPDLTPVSVFTSNGEPCTIDGVANTVTCPDPGTTPVPWFGAVGGEPVYTITAAVDPSASGTLTSSFEVSGGGAADVATVDSTLISPSPPPFGIDSFDSQLQAPDGSAFTQAGGHPDGLSVAIDFNTLNHPDFLKGDLYPVEPPKDVVAELPAGLVGNPSILARCTISELANAQATRVLSLCPPQSQVGTIQVRLSGGFSIQNLARVDTLPLFNMAPPSGLPARFGFNFLGTVVTLDARLRYGSDYGISVSSRNIPQGLAVSGSTLEFWGVPAAPSHERERACPGKEIPRSGGKFCPNSATPEPFFRLPTSCPPNGGEGLPWQLSMDSWRDFGRVNELGEPDPTDPAWAQTAIASHQLPGYPAAPEDWGAEVGTTGCDSVPVKGNLTALPTSIDAETSTGLAVHLEVPNPGFDNPTGIASSDLKKVKVSLPQGVTINPSQAEGLGVCSPAQYESTELSFFPTPGKGCPDDSKIGTVEVHTPLLEETIPGDVYIAKQFDNPFDSLLAIYVVLAEPERGILVKVAGKVETDGTSGRIVTTFDDLPQLPFESFDFKFREGARAPLVTPPTCGTYTTEAEIEGHSAPGKPIVSKSSFEIARGIGGGACPSGAPGFNPGFSAGTVNNAAGAFSPTLMRLTRLDGEQNLTRFSATLAPGLLAKLAGVERCSDAAIATANGKNGRDELASPSCPANSKIGRTLAGAGVGSVLTYVPGSLYLGGPYHGAPLSVVSITPAVAGPFDVGTVVVREALDIDPVTGVASVDGSASDPIPHILKGIPLKLRDLRVYVDRDQFTLNPTGCARSAIGATLWGSALDVFSPADDVPVDRSARFQAADCGDLGFKPRLKINLGGGTKRGAHPALRALLRPRSGDANLERIQVLLPGSELLENSNIRTICTRIQFAADGGHGAGCPKASIYGNATAWTPLLDEPLQGPVYLRSSSHELPDMVLALSGLVDIEAVGRIDSKGGRIRSTFANLPDAPLEKVLLRMQGGKKSLLVHSADICKSSPRAKVNAAGQNGKPYDFRPPVRGSCGKRKR